MSPAAATIQTQGLVDQDRLKAAVVLLREAGPRGLTRAQLGKGLGNTSLRTVDRALKLLEEQGAQLGRSREGRPAVLVFTLKKGPAWDEHVTPQARLALRLATLTLAHSGTTLWQEQMEAIEGIVSGHMSSRDKRLFETLQRSVKIQGGVEDPIEPQDVIEPILKALDGPKELELDYQSAGAAQSSVRVVVPYALTHDLYSGGAFLLVWDPARKHPLHLRLSRINRAKALARPGIIPDPGLLARAAQYQIGGWMSDQEPFEVQLRIKGKHWVQAFKEAPPALPEFEADPDADGEAMEVRFKGNHELGALRWILQFGAAVVVRAPQWLREKVAEQFEAGLAANRQTGPAAASIRITPT
jgi:predicted DNA-binding transcriptional regulator YafY